MSSLLARRLSQRYSDRLSEKTIRDRIDNTRARGWSTVTGFAIPNATGVGAPIFDANRRPIAAISVANDASRMTAKRISTVLPLLEACKNQIENAIKMNASPLAGAM